MWNILFCLLFRWYLYNIFDIILVVDTFCVSVHSRQSHNIYRLIDTLEKYIAKLLKEDEKRASYHKRAAM